MKRNVRKSTTEKSTELNEILRNREIKSKQRKSRKLLKVAENNKASIDKALELSAIQSANNSEVEGENSQEDEYWFDTSNIDLTGHTSSPVSPVPTSHQDPDTWSHSNKFFPKDCVSTPAFPLPNIEEVDSANLSDFEFNPPIRSAESFMMDERTLKTKVAEIENNAEDVEILMDRFNPDTITILDKDDYKTELDKIFTQLREFQGKVNKFKGTLDLNSDSHNVASARVTTVLKDLKTKVLANEAGVKKQMVKLVNESDSARSERSAEVELEKLKLKVSNAKIKFDNLKGEVESLSEVDDMSEQQVRESVVSSREWKKDLKIFQDLKEKLDVEMVSIKIDEEDQTAYNNAYDTMVKIVTEKMTKLLSADKDLGLYSLSDGKSKTLVHYPESFGGSMGEDVFRFIKEFKEALAADQVRKADEIKTLIKHLKGDAKDSIGQHHKSLDSALTQLEDNFGCPRLIVERLRIMTNHSVISVIGESTVPNKGLTPLIRQLILFATWRT